VIDEDPRGDCFGGETFDDLDATDGLQRSIVVGLALLGTRIVG